MPVGSSARLFLFSPDSLPLLSLFSVYLHISLPRLPFSESHGWSRLFSQLASSRLLSFSLIPFASIPFHSWGCARSFVSTHLSIPLVASARLPFASFSVSLFLFLSCFLSLLRIYRGEQRMWMGWVSPRLGERSITCEPKGEEIRGCAAYLQERSGAQAGMVEYCGTRAHCVPPRCPSHRPAHSSRGRLSSFPLFRPPPPRFPAVPPGPSPPHGPAPYVRNEPRVIHHNRFTCTSAVRTFTALVSAAPVLPAQTAPFS